MSLGNRHGYDGPRGFYAYGHCALIDSATLYFTPGFLKEPRAGWIVDGVLVRHVDPVRVWRLTGDSDAPYPGLFAYQAMWPD